MENTAERGFILKLLKILLCVRGAAQQRFRIDRHTFGKAFPASKQVFPRHPSALYDATKLIKRFDLDLSYALASQVEIRGKLRWIEAYFPG